MTIQSLPAVNNVFGALQSQNGVQYLSGLNTPNVNYLAHVSRREYPSNNPPGSDGFRRHSSYRRYVRLYDEAESYSRYYRTNNRDQRWYVFGKNESGANLSSYCHPYWGNSVSCIKDSNIQNESIVRALNKIADGKANIGTALAESKRTFQQLSGTAIQLLTAYRHARHGRWSSVGKSLGLTRRQILSGRYPANKWLEYQYGWKPLLSDINSLYDVMGGSLRNDSFFLYGKGGGERHMTDSDTWDFEGIDVVRQKSAQQICVTRLVGSLDSPRWRQAGQLGLINPLAVAWEVVPFSFLLDWFMPVGNMLEALTARAGLNFVTGSTTFLTGGVVSQVGQKRPGGLTPIAYGRLRMRVFEHERTRLTYWPKPMLYVRDSPFSATRSLNALALWRSSIKTR